MEPLAVGEPVDGYPWKWAVYRWLEGDTAAGGSIASDLVQFPIALQGCRGLRRAGPKGTSFTKIFDSRKILASSLVGELTS